MRKTFLTLALAVILSGCSNPYWVKATVVEKAYTPSTTGVGFNGKRTAIIATEEKYVVILQYQDGSAGSVEVNAATWAVLKKGEHVKAYVHWYGVSDIVEEDGNY